MRTAPRRLTWDCVKCNHTAAPAQPSTAERLSTDEPALFHQSEQSLGAPENGGAVVPDLDEAAHGLFVLHKYGHAVIKEGSFNAITKDVCDETTQFSSAPNEWLRAQVGEPGTFHPIAHFGMSGAMILLSGLAIKAGYEEATEAAQMHQKLNEKRKAIEKKLVSLSAPDETQPASAHPVATHSYAQKIESQSLVAINGALQHNYYDGGIGCSSLVSGGAIFTKVAQDTALQAATMTVAKSGALTTATTVLGTVGTLIFGPLAAGAAVALGGFFVHKANRVGRELAEDRRIIEATAAGGRVRVGQVDKAYQAFIDRKFASRENFATRFKRWNSGFLGGACLYAVSAGAKAVLGVAALAGFAAAIATPIVFALCLGTGIVGGITMSICSWQFLKSHGKCKRQQAYRLEESPFLGRCFDAIQTIDALTNSHADGHRTASGLRAQLFHFVSARDTIRQRFLQARAQEMHKFRAWEQRATDNAATKGLVSQARQRSRNLGALGSYVFTYLGQLFRGAALKAAAREAEQVYAIRADDLTTVGLTRWFDGHDGAATREAREAAQRDLLTDMLTQQKLFLQNKRMAYEGLHPSFTDAAASGPHVHATFSAAHEEARADHARLEKIERVLTTGNLMQLNLLKRDFLRLQGVDPAGLPGEDDTAALNRRLAQYLIADLSDELTATRGILFDMHRRSVRLQQALQPVPHSLTQALVQADPTGHGTAAAGFVSA